MVTPLHPKKRLWLSQAEAAEHLGITDRTLRRMVARGEVPAYRLGPRLTRFDQGDLDAALRRVPAGGDAG
jgi:excisionase family DNA binding protein